MNDYSDVLQVMGAMILVSVLITNVNRASFLNKAILIDGEYETEVTALAQDFMEESRSMAFDEETASGFVPVNIPAGFSTIGTDGSESSRADFNDFDDYEDYSEVITTIHGDFNVSVKVVYVNATTQLETASKSTLKKMKVSVSNASLTQFNNSKELKTYNFSYIRSYYAD